MSGNYVELHDHNNDNTDKGYCLPFETKVSTGPVPDYLKSIPNNELRDYAVLKDKELKGDISSIENLRLLNLEIPLYHKLPYFKSFVTFLKDVNDGKQLTWDSNENKAIPLSEGFLRSLKVEKTLDYISNGGTFYSPSRGKCTRGLNNYKGVCTTGTFNILRRLGFPKVSNNTTFNVGTLNKMGLKFIKNVNAHNPGKSGYVPRDGDVAIWPRFQKASGKYTQHMAVWVNGFWRSDTKQSKMACYNNEPNEPLCKIYRYGGINNQNDIKQA